MFDNEQTLKAIKSFCRAGEKKNMQDNSNCPIVTNLLCFFLNKEIKNPEVELKSPFKYSVTNEILEKFSKLDPLQFLNYFAVTNVSFSHVSPVLSPLLADNDLVAPAPENTDVPSTSAPPISISEVPCAPLTLVPTPTRSLKENERADVLHHKMATAFATSLESVLQSILATCANISTVRRSQLVQALFK
eukprot:Pompholyxophrys_punicea_v1_NODE_536_length_1733_cov_3.898689.p2 type:complete len:190 gc:universal NODE_536_length_1733_cov_3.898689:300-869(+)